MNNRNKQRITALTLAMTLLMGGCSSKKKNNRFELTENENNEIVAMGDSYIDVEYIDNYYVVEVYNKMEKEDEIYIAMQNFVYRKYANDYVEYYDIFSNLKIVDTVQDEDEKEILSYVKATNFKDYIVSLGLGQFKYSYEDMKNIYDVIKDNYVFENNNTLTKKREIE